MNYKRKKSKRNVKCTLCTKYRWMGNSKGRKRISDERHISFTVKDLDEDLKKNWIRLDEYTYKHKTNPDLMLSVG